MLTRSPTPRPKEDLPLFFRITPEAYSATLYCFPMDGPPSAGAHDKAFSSYHRLHGLAIWFCGYQLGIGVAGVSRVSKVSKVSRVTKEFKPHQCISALVHKCTSAAADCDNYTFQIQKPAQRPVFGIVIYFVRRGRLVASCGRFLRPLLCCAVLPADRI